MQKTKISRAELAKFKNTNWYLGLINNYDPDEPENWTENVAYSNPTRVPWTPRVADDETSISFTCVFKIYKKTTVKGVFLTSNKKKLGSTDTLFSTVALEGGAQILGRRDIFKVTYVVEIYDIPG